MAGSLDPAQAGVGPRLPVDPGAVRVDELRIVIPPSRSYTVGCPGSRTLCTGARAQWCWRVRDPRAAEPG